MKDGKSIWKERATTYWEKAARYLRLIFNSGFLFTIYILVIVGSYYYSVLLNTLPPHFPAIIVFILVFAHFLTRGNIRTFVKHADIVFLLPYEGKLDSYFRASLNYSFAWQSAIIIAIMIVLSPLYMTFLAHHGLLFIIAFLLVAKAWNVVATWEEQRLQHRNERLLHFVFRGIFNAFYAFFLFSGAALPYLLVMLLLMWILYFFYYRKFRHHHSLKWEQLVEIEERMVHSFYQVANLFADVPELRHRIHERHYLNRLLRHLTNGKKSVYHFILPRTFVRANEYAGIYFRLTAIAAFSVFLLPNGWMKLLVMILFMHMVTNQLKPISLHYDRSEMIELYPVSNSMKKDALTELTFRLLLTMTVVLVVVIIATSSYVFAILALVLGVAYSFVGSRTFIHQQNKESYV